MTHYMDRLYEGKKFSELNFSYQNDIRNDWELEREYGAADDGAWAGKETVDGNGRVKYSAVHLLADDAFACGAPEPQGDWVAESDSNGARCKRCAKRAALAA